MGRVCDQPLVDGGCGGRSPPGLESGLEIAKYYAGNVFVHERISHFPRPF
jgi:hypothetical protein